MVFSDNVFKKMLMLLRLGMGITTLSDENETYDPLLMQDVYVMAKHHDLAHIVAYAIKKNSLECDKELFAKFDKQYMLAFFRFQHQKHDLAVISEAFEKSGIKHIPLKGAVMRNFYPAEWMRIGCDIDILVKPEELDKAVEVLKNECSYECVGKGSHDVAFNSAAGTHIELHYDLLEDHINGEDIVLEKFWDYATPNEGKKYCYAISDDMFYYYHIGHMAKHFINGGCGVRPFLDIWVLNYRIEFNEEKRQKLLSDGGYEKFNKTAKMLSDAWFLGKEYTEIAKAIENYILGGGVYGSLDNMVAVNTAKKGGKFKYLLSRIFLPYNQLKFHYPSLDGRKWLTPIYEVRRWFKIVFCGGLKRSLREINATGDVSQSKQNDAAEFLNELGIK